MTYREGLPVVPFRLRSRPVQKGYPVPWFVSRNDEGLYDLRLADPRKVVRALQDRLCWVCGSPLMATLSFVVGPMCTITRTTAEPGCHMECAEFAAQACPFLTQVEKRRRVAGLPAVDAPPGLMYEGRPDVCCVWRTRSCSTFDDGRGGLLIKVGAPVNIAWYSAGRAATRDEVVAGLDRSYALLLEQAHLDVDPDLALVELNRQRDLALQYIP